MDKANIYKLIEVEELVKYKKELPVFLFDLPYNESDYYFKISPISGWINYTNYAEIRKNKNPYSLPKDKNEVIKHVKAYIKKVGENLKRNPAFKNINPYPDYLKLDEPVQVTPVINAVLETVDHWVCVYHVSLNSPNGLIPLVGSNVTFRVGNGGKVIGCSIKYRKIVGAFSSDLNAFIDHSPNDNHNHGHKEEEQEKSEPILCYKLGGESEHQNFLAPFYLKANGHHYHFTPASNYSIRVQIYEIHSSTGATLEAQVIGGSGNYTYEWSSWQVEDWDTSFTDLGSNMNCKVGIGVHNVILTVIDKQNPEVEIIAQTQQTIYARGESNEVSNANEPENIT